MGGQGRQAGMVTAVAAALGMLAAWGDGASIAVGQTTNAALPGGSIYSPAMLDDAALHDVFFLDAHQGWAVGDRGVIRVTNDGGKTWAMQSSPVECRLDTVCFLDPQRGWAAGGAIRPYTHKSTGVLLHTIDGGRHWQTIDGPILPAVRRLKMLDERRGFALGTGSALYPSGVFVTSDGGRSWNAARGEQWGAWLAGDLRADGVGALAGRDGQLATIRGTDLTASRQPGLGLRGLRAMRLVGATGGWLVGDGGLAMTTNDCGLTWQLPPGPLPRGLDRHIDFSALAVQGSHVWIAGAPGTLVLHSPDAGQSWETLATGQTLPIESLAFADAQNGWAVGALGMILATRDGGRSWQRQRSGGTRAALVAIVADARELPLEVFASESASEGYLGVAEIIGRRDLEGIGPQESDPAQRAHDALVQVGACGAEQAWRYPLRQSGLEFGPDAVLAHWDRANDGGGATRLEEDLVRSIRQWRPDVVVTPSPQRAADAASRLVAQLTLQAIEKAADPSAYPEQIQGLRLAPWQVKKTFGLLPPEDQGAINLTAAQLAPRLGRSLADLASGARGLLVEKTVAPPNNIGLELLVDRLPQGSGRHDLFSGLGLQPGGEARRNLDRLAATNLDHLRRLAAQQRNLQQLIARTSQSPIGAANMLAQLDDLTRGLGELAAADLLFQLASQYATRGDGELAAETYGALLEKYPKHPLAESAVIWLLRYYASAEMAHRLTRHQRVIAHEGQVAGNDDGSTKLRPVGAHPPALDPIGRTNPPRFPDAAPIPVLDPTAVDPVVGGPGANEPQPSGSLLTWPGAVRLGVKPSAVAPAAALAPVELPDAAIVAAPDERADRALQLARYLERSRPALFADKSIRFPFAAATRTLGLKRDAEKLYASLAAGPVDDPWRAAARCEQWIVKPTGLPAKPLCTATRALSRPKLDGQLDEACWRAAAALDLRSEHHDDAAWPAAVKLAHDAEFLYVAISCAKAPGVRYEPNSGPRSYDGDLSGQDRVEVLLDIDRDYATFYRFAIDSRGWTGEACCGDRRWNPAWYVATADAPDAWTAECAIPLVELVGQAPRPGAIWAAGLQRVVPGVGFQSWTQPAAVEVRAEGFGLLVLE